MGFHGKMENNFFTPLASLLSKDFGVGSEREDRKRERDIPMKDLLRHLILAAKVIDHNCNPWTDCNFRQRRFGIEEGELMGPSALDLNVEFERVLFCDRMEGDRFPEPGEASLEIFFNQRKRKAPGKTLPR
jgi:hypothetical protein